MMVQIAGGVVWNPKLGIAVVNQNNNSWSLPKGHVEKGETHVEAAVREITEETGIPKENLRFINTLGAYERSQIKRDKDQPTEMRTITLYLFKTDYENLSPNDPENPEVRWVAIDKVSSLLTHPKDKEFYSSIKARISLDNHKQ
jgi:8-oxo-dGTP pyrophosphatase MutT (NUDIX family)